MARWPRCENVWVEFFSLLIEDVIGNVGKYLTLEGSPPIGLLAISSPGKRLGARRDFLFDFLIETAKEFTGRSLKNHFTRQGRLQTRFTSEPLISAHLGPTLRSQEKSHFILGKRQAFSV